MISCDRLNIVVERSSDETALWGFGELLPETRQADGRMLLHSRVHDMLVPT